jgi:hypothetical protein
MRSNAELKKLDTVQDWVIRDILPRGGTMMVAGPPKIGKSLLMMDICSAISGHDDFWHGFKVEETGNIMCCEFDMPVGSHRRRVLQLEKTGLNFNKMFHVTVDEVPPGFNLLREGSFNWLKAQVEDLRPLVIVFDVVRRFYQGDENSSDLAGQFMQAVSDILIAGGSSGILVHHTNKTSEVAKNMGFEKDPISAVRGSSVIAGSVDTICAFNDAGTQLWYQGRDVNLRYGVKRGANGIYNRWIKAGASNRASEVQHLAARFLLQVPTLGKDDVYALCLPHVADLDYKEFDIIWQLVAGKAGQYEWG